MLNDEVLINQLKSRDRLFRQWADLHHELEHRLEGINRLKFLTSEEEIQRKELQKKKLLAKDHMHLILSRFKRVN